MTSSRARPPDAIRIDLDPNAVGHGLSELVLVLLDVVRELLERQAIRRLDAGDLTADQIEAVGTALRDAAQRLNALHEAVAESATESLRRKDLP
ncbi:MAG: hypothetical protein QOE97_3128 [Pseudonocardiales bacterium]|jgi:hypothetical protein|nr:hypothetical protein [Pseudonocardiales bacterium]